MTLENFIQQIEAKLVGVPLVGGRIKFAINDLGEILIDGTQSPPVVSTEDADADTTLRLSADVLSGILAGTQNPTMAFMTGKLKVEGSMGYAMKINSLLED